MAPIPQTTPHTTSPATSQADLKTAPQPAYDASLSATDRKRTGAWFTPPALVEHVVTNTVGRVAAGEVVRVLDPACGDGRFLVAAADLIRSFGGIPVLTGVDVDLGALRGAGRAQAKNGSEARGGIEAIEADALSYDWGARRFDIVVGNPPFLSQMATATARDGRSRFGGGPYADAAADFLALCARLVDVAGRVGLVLPLSLLTARDAGPIRADVGRSSSIRWFWSSSTPMFDAMVLTCAVGLSREPSTGWVARTAGPDFDVIEPLAASALVDENANHHWGRLIADSSGLPELPPIDGRSTMSDRGLVTANFRDQYYGLVGAVRDDATGPPLVTTGLIDVAVCHWGRRPTRFAKERFAAPRVDRSHLAPFMQRWADRCLVPKVLVATQSRVIEAVVDENGEWLPAVPVIRIVPHRSDALWEIAAVLTSPVASLSIARQSVGSGLSASTFRVSQRTLGRLPWPIGDLTRAVDALRSGEVVACGRAIDAAFGIDDTALLAWWVSSLPH